MKEDSVSGGQSSQSKTPSESFILKLNFVERNLQRVKEENGRLVQKITRLEEENGALKKKKQTFSKQIQQLQMAVVLEKAEKEGIAKKVQVRYQRQLGEQNQNFNKGEKEIFQKRVQRTEASIAALNYQNEALLKKCSDLTAKLEQNKSQNPRLRSQIVVMQKQNLEDIDRIHQVQQLYKEKVSLLEQQNGQLRKQIDSLVLEVKLFQRKKEIEGLLTYEKSIGSQKKSQAKKKQIFSADKQGNENQYSECCCQELQSELYEREQLIELLKEKNLRLQSEVSALKQRCSTLQGIICKGSISIR